MPRVITANMWAKSREGFLEALRQGMSVSAAVKASGMGQTYLYERKKTDEEFAKDWDAAIEVGSDMIEDEIKRRGVDGWDEPLAFQGQLTGDVVRKYSDTLLIFLAKARRPEKFRDVQKLTVSGPNDGPIQIQDARAEVEALLARKEARKKRAPDSPTDRPTA